MFKWSVEPVLLLSVTVLPGGCDIQLLSCKLRGSPLVESINDNLACVAGSSWVVVYLSAVSADEQRGPALAGHATGSRLGAAGGGPPSLLVASSL
ncbi:uncharacterized protein cgl81 [Haematococcus lacustris]|uniref:Uncharacterized protein cgl81 n=1 Tax=Haematococcus lacustris TaxID=44745 RepID=A0A699ZGA0_HAELA|nr:uncharacterized protein cgl81 [Haematococcus lacustris]